MRILWSKICGVNTAEYINIQNLQQKKTVLYLKVQPIYENWLFDSPRQSEKQVYKIKCTAASDQN